MGSVFPASQSGYQLLINGQAYNGWLSISVTQSLDTMAGAFEVVTTDRWPGQPSEWAIQCGDAVQVQSNGATLITGWVDDVEIDEDAQTHQITARGRGRTCDLVDCTAMNQPGSWSQRTILQIVSDICSPFGIGVTATGNVGAPFASFALQQGEKAKEAIDRLCQQRGLLPIETSTGDLVLANPASTTASGQLALGVNILHGQARYSAAERYGAYTVKGNRQGNDQDNGATVAQVIGTASDAAVTRYRPLLILAEDQATTASATNRAKFAATVRAARAQTGTLTVVGSTDGGAPWAPNTLVPIVASDLGLNDTLLINEVTFNASESGTTAEIHVVRPEAYSLGAVDGSDLTGLT